MRDKILLAAFGSSDKSVIEKMLISELSKTNKTKYSMIALRYVPYFWLESSIYTVRNRYTSVRKLIEESDIKFVDLALEIFKLGKAVGGSTIIETKNKNLEREIVFFDIENFKRDIAILRSKIEKKAFTLSNGQNQKQVLANLSIVYLALTTGRRFFEIMKIVEVLKNEDNQVIFKGLAKKRDDKNSSQGFILDDFETVVKMINNVREYYDDFTKDLTAQQINASYSKTLNNFLKKELNQKITFHRLRERYVEMCELEFNKGKIDKDIFRAYVLGHDIDTEASEFYTHQKGV